MIKSLTKHGNSWALVIDKPILELLNFDPVNPLEISTDGQKLVITQPSLDDPKKKVRAAREKVNKRYGKVFKKLAE